MNIRLLIQIAIGITGYTVWGAMAYLDASLRADFLKFNVAMAVGTIGLVLRDMQAASSAAPVVPATITPVPPAGVPTPVATPALLAAATPAPATPAASATDAPAAAQ